MHSESEDNSDYHASRPSSKPGKKVYDNDSEEALEETFDAFDTTLNLRKDITTVGMVVQEDIKNNLERKESLARSTTSPAIPLTRKLSQRRISTVEKKRSEIKQKFQRFVRVLIIMLNWTKLMLKRSRYEKDESDAIDLSKGSTFADSDFAFNVSSFKAKKEVKLTHEMRYILQLLPHERTDEHIQTVMHGLQSLNTFNEYPLEVQRKLAKVAYYFHVPGNKLIIRQGHKGYNFYIIISGKALVDVMKEDPVTHESRSSIVARLGQGQSFGEIALMHTVARNASIISEEPMQMLAIERTDFHDIFMKGVAGKIPDHIEYLLNLPFMKHFPREKLISNPQMCLVSFFRRKALIAENNKNHEYLVTVKTGSCGVLKKLDVNETDTPMTPKKRGFSPKPIIGKQESKVNSGLQIHKQIKRQFFDMSISKKRKELNSALSNHHRVSEIEEKETRTLSMPLNLQKDFELQNLDFPKKCVAVRVSTLKPGETFGLSAVIFRGEKNIAKEESAPVSLVSNGAECILLNRDFFIQHSNMAVRLDVRDEARPYPQEHAFVDNYYIQQAWDQQKKDCLKNALHLAKRHKEERERQYILSHLETK